jgi:hypothetical protein
MEIKRRSRNLNIVEHIKKRIKDMEEGLKERPESMFIRFELLWCKKLLKGLNKERGREE